MRCEIYRVSLARCEISSPRTLSRYDVKLNVYIVYKVGGLGGGGERCGWRFLVRSGV